MTTPAFSPELATAFAATRFEVHGTTPITLRVSHDALACVAWLDAVGASQAVVVTAWNPFGRAQAAGANDAANQALLIDIQGTGLTWRPARGVSATDDWFEDSYCVFDAPARVVDGRLRRFDQHAVLRVRRGEAPALIWHPDHR